MYRCWVVHARSWRVIALSIVLWFSCLVAFALVVESFSKFPPQAVGSVVSLSVFTFCHIANNIYGTCMIPYHTTQRSVLTIRVGAIVYKIMRVAQTSSGTSRRLKKTSLILAESGISYTVSGVLNLIFQADGNLRDRNIYLACAFDIFVCSPLCSYLRRSVLYTVFRTFP
jgi:hypothetical protein